MPVDFLAMPVLRECFVYTMMNGHVKLVAVGHSIVGVSFLHGAAQKTRESGLTVLCRLQPELKRMVRTD